MGAACRTNWDQTNAHKNFVGALEWKISLGKASLKWESNIKIDVKIFD
jgi:hypothetical protein